MCVPWWLFGAMTFLCVKSSNASPCIFSFVLRGSYIPVVNLLFWKTFGAVIVAVVAEWNAFGTYPMSAFAAIGTLFYVVGEITSGTSRATFFVVIVRFIFCFTSVHRFILWERYFYIVWNPRLNTSWQSHIQFGSAFERGLCGIWFKRMCK